MRKRDTPAASLKERIYCETGKSGKDPMAGILIYVAVPDEEGSLGGLMELAKPERFLRLLTGAFEAATWCSLDPVCSEQEGHGPDLLNRAACHACALVPETSCSYGKRPPRPGLRQGRSARHPCVPGLCGGPGLMARRKFELPGIQDLGKEQEEARALPTEGRHLIVGGPGTGKSVLALIRARRHFRERDDYLFLVFNHLLHRASGQLFGSGLASRTWIRWFLDTFEEITGQPAPRLEPNSNEYREIDWAGVDEIIQSLPHRDGWQPPFLVIDEGQDMPREFYSALVSLGFDRFFVVADQNQQITEANSSRRDIENCLVIDTDDVIELKQNYRNPYQVARLAREFHTGDPASPPPEIPGPAPGAVPQLYYYEQDNLDAVARGILRLTDRDPRQLVGIIAPNNRARERYLEALRSVDVQLDNPRPAINTYHGKDRTEIAFDEGGLLVINAQACKGLEFDTVVLADIDEHYFRRRDPDVARRLFYVMIARARERVFMFMRRGGSKEIENILPKDQEVLGRKEL